MMRHYVFVAGLLSATALYSHWIERGAADRLAAPLDSIPTALAGWRFEQNAPLTSRAAERLKPSAYLSRVYSNDGSKLGLFIAYYDQQRAGESMHSPKQCLPGSGWTIWQQGSTRLAGRYEVNRFSIQNAGRRAVVLYWYQSRRNLIASEYVAKLRLIEEAFWNGQTSGALVRVIIDDQPEAVRRGTEFASALIPEVQSSLGR